VRDPAFTDLETRKCEGFIGDLKQKKARSERLKIVIMRKRRLYETSEFGLFRP